MDDGHVELIPVVAVPADQAWFWSERWQAMNERRLGTSRQGISRSLTDSMVSTGVFGNSDAG